MEITSDWSNKIQVPAEQTEMQSVPHVGGKIKQDGDNSATPMGHEATPQTSNTSPTADAREATTGKKPDLEAMTQERLSNDPDYQELMAKQGALKAAEVDFGLVDAATLFGRNDGIITLNELKDVANDTTQPDGTRAAAQRLLSNVSLWNELASGVDGKNDNKVGINDVSRLKEATRMALLEIKTAVRDAIKAENAPTPQGAGTAPGVSGTPGGTGTQTSPAEGATPLFKAPTPSTKPGMEGAVENISNTLASIGDSCAAISAQLMDPNLKPEEKQKLQAKFNELQQLQSMLTAMYTQLQTAIANLMKMYSDVAMNSIHNMK